MPNDSDLCYDCGGPRSDHTHPFVPVPNDIVVCEDCGEHNASYRCEKGTKVCPICASIHRRDGHLVHDLVEAD